MADSIFRGVIDIIDCIFATDHKDPPRQRPPGRNIGVKIYVSNLYLNSTEKKSSTDQTTNVRNLIFSMECHLGIIFSATGAIFLFWPGN